MDRPYSWFMKTLSLQDSEVPKGAASYLFNNVNGSANVLVNGDLVAPGQSLRLSGDANEVDKTQYIVVVPSGASLSLWYKKYL